MHDPLDALLAPPPAAPPRPDLFDQTVALLRRQQRTRRLTSIGALITALAAGLFSLLAYPPPEDVRVAKALPSKPPMPEQLAPVLTATDLEWIALEHPEAAPELYREAGDRHLAVADPADAVRCYGNALDSGKPQDLEVSSDDSWLLMAVKQARKKERNECDK